MDGVRYAIACIVGNLLILPIYIVSEVIGMAITIIFNGIFYISSMYSLFTAFRRDGPNVNEFELVLIRGPIAVNTSVIILLIVGNTMGVNWVSAVFYILGLLAWMTYALASMRLAFRGESVESYKGGGNRI